MEKIKREKKNDTKYKRERSEQTIERETQREMVATVKMQCEREGVRLPVLP